MMSVAKATVVRHSAGPSKLKRKTIRSRKRFITDDTIDVAIKAIAAHTIVMDIGPTTVTATAIGHMGIMAMAGDPA
jgi:hypothetical protein